MKKILNTSYDYKFRLLMILLLFLGGVVTSKTIANGQFEGSQAPTNSLPSEQQLSEIRSQASVQAADWWEAGPPTDGGGGGGAIGIPVGSALSPLLLAGFLYIVVRSTKKYRKYMNSNNSN